MSFINKSHKKSLGFTLVEALVSLGIFSVVVVTASGVILSVISSNKKNQAISSVVNNLNYSIESMVRDIKTGYDYRCIETPDPADLVLDTYKLSPDDCNGTSGKTIDHITLISTITGKEQVVRYELLNPGGSDAKINKTLYTTDSEGSVSSVSYPLTDVHNVSIDKLNFTIKTPPPLIPATTTASTGQPSVFLILKGTAKVNEINISDFFIQTYISQRLPNFI